jgi:hypothetical protein
MAVLKRGIMLWTSFVTLGASLWLTIAGVVTQPIDQTVAMLVALPWFAHVARIPTRT